MRSGFGKKIRVWKEDPGLERTMQLGVEITIKQIKNLLKKAMESSPSGWLWKRKCVPEIFRKLLEL
jgi:hypothetical protein